MILDRLDVRELARVDGRARPAADAYGNTAISQVLPRYGMLGAAGRIFAIEMGAGTEIIPVVAPATTSPEYLLYNNSPDELLVVLGVASFLKSGTLGLGASLQMAAALGKQTAPTLADYTGTIKTSLAGKKDFPQVYLINNQTLVGGTPAWVPVATTKHDSIGTDSVGDGLVNMDLKGLFVARPNGGAVAAEIVAETGTSAAFTICFVFAMIPASGLL